MGFDLSEVQLLARTHSVKAADLSDYQVFKAYTIPALQGEGVMLDRIKSLPPEAQALLQVRKTASLQGAEAALSFLDQWAKEQNLVLQSIWVAEEHFLRGILLHRLGQVEAAAHALLEAHVLFNKLGEERRAFRSLVNVRIIQANIASYESGALFALKKEACANELWDIYADILKASSGEHLLDGNFKLAERDAREATEAYQRDGFPEDESVAFCLLGIAAACSGRSGPALEAERKVRIHTGKVQSYHQILCALLGGEDPNVPAGHPLEQMRWPKAEGKKASITGKIVQALKRKSCTPDQLIEEVWGCNAHHPSYRNRLFNALQQIKKKNLVRIRFDGEKYELLD